MLFPVELGRIANINIYTPPEQYLGNFLQQGHPQYIYEWLEENIDGWDAVILSSDMLAYGGLIASRTPNTPLEQAKGNLKKLKEIKSCNRDIPIYAFSILMRTSITALDDQYASYWENIHRYSYLNDPNLQEEQPHVLEELNKLEKDIPKAILEEYKGARIRNHEINKFMIELVNGDIVDYLIIGQEDATVYGMHKKEQEILYDMVHSYNLSDRVKFVTGADELAMNLLTKFILEQTNEKPSIRVVYSSQDGANKVAPFEDIPIDKNIDAHIESIGAERQQIEDDSAHIYLFVNTPKETSNNVFADNYMDFIEDIYSQQNTDKIIAIADLAYANGSDIEFLGKLKGNINLSSLSSYGAWNTAGNTLGTVLSHSVIYWLSNKREILNYSAHINFLLQRFVDDHIYQSIVREKLSDIIRDDGLSPLNLETYENKRHYDQILYTVMAPKIDDFITTYFNNVKSYEIITLKLPWMRTFEVWVEIQATTV